MFGGRPVFARSPGLHGSKVFSGRALFGEMLGVVEVLFLAEVKF